MPVWKKISEILNPGADHIKAAETLLAEYQKKGYLSKTQRELLLLPDAVIAVFYDRLMDGKVPVSPVSDKVDSGWMAETDFCFINVRATGVDQAGKETEFGNFIQAAKLLPGIRATGIHLGPFLDYDFGTIYAVKSLKTIAPQVVHKGLFDQGLMASRQLDAFVQAAHVLGKAVGFDLEPHTAQYSIPALEVPEAFRWIRLFGNDRNWLDYYLQPDTVYNRENQERFAAEIRTLISGFLKSKSLHTFDEEDSDTSETLAKKRQAFADAVQLMIKEGYWTVPVHSWDSEGLPRFSGYNSQDNYPLFTYLNRQHRDSSAYAYHIVTPFMFYQNVPLQGTVIRQKPELNHAGLDLFCSAFNYWRDKHHFDFVRHDSVDHVFDSIFDGDGSWPLSDRPTPYILSEFIRRSKLPGKPYIGHLAERMGNEVEDYQSIGYDVLLGSDMMEVLGQPHMEKSFRLQGQLDQLNQRRKSAFAISYALDTHDTGNPFMWGQSLVEKEGPEGMKTRYFLSRFLGWGRGRRPKYEVMGLADLSFGLFPANVTEKNLTWTGDTDFTKFYHQVEDFYQSLRDDLSKSSLCECYAGVNYAWWMLTAPDKVIIAAVWYEAFGAFSETGLENSEYVDKYAALRGDFPFSQKDLPSKVHGQTLNLKSLKAHEIGEFAKIWTIGLK